MDEKSRIVQETEQLAWLMIDQAISDPQFERLIEILQTSAEGRRRYQEVLQLDSMLHAHFASLRQPPQAPPGAHAA